MDLMDVLIGMYVVVFGALSLHTLRRWQQSQRDQEALVAINASIQQELECADEADQTIGLRVDRRTIHVRPGDIHYIESQGDYVLVCLDSDRHMTKQTLSALENELANRGFCGPLLSRADGGCDSTHDIRTRSGW